MKLNLQNSILLIILSSLIMFLGYEYIFKKDSSYEYQIKELKEENDSLKLEKDKNQKEIQSLENNYQHTKQRAYKLKNEIEVLSKEIERKKGESNSNKNELDSIKLEIDRRRRVIDSLLITPNQLDGNSLIKSLKNKFTNE